VVLTLANGGTATLPAKEVREQVGKQSATCKVAGGERFALHEAPNPTFST
jgi:hypothetical protein